MDTTIPQVHERRMSADERRESIVLAAGTVFGRHGYDGATTDQIAKAAGISQPYVVRMFGSKEALFLEVIDRSRDALLDEFRRVLAADGPGAEPLAKALGDAYVELTQDRGIHLPLMHAFMLGAEPVIGARSRQGFLAIWAFLRDEAGFSAADASAFLAHGMLINVLLGLGMPALAGDRADADELLTEVCGDKLPFMLQHTA